MDQDYDELLFRFQTNSRRNPEYAMAGDPTLSIGALHCS